MRPPAPLMKDDIGYDLRRLMAWTEERSPRTRLMLARYFAGAPVTDIMREFGVSRERVRQLVWKFRMRNLRLRRVA